MSKSSETLFYCSSSHRTNLSRYNCSVHAVLGALDALKIQIPVVLTTRRLEVATMSKRPGSLSLGRQPSTSTRIRVSWSYVLKADKLVAKPEERELTSGLPIFSANVGDRGHSRRSCFRGVSVARNYVGQIDGLQVLAVRL